MYLMDLPTEVITKICEKLFTRSETSQIDYWPFFELRQSVFKLVNKSSQALRCCSQLQAIGTPILYGSNIFAMSPTSSPTPDLLLGASKAVFIQRLIMRECHASSWRRTLAHYPALRFLEIVLVLRKDEELPWPCKLSQKERNKGEWKQAFLRDGRRSWARTLWPSDIIKESSSLVKRGVEVVISGREVESVQRIGISAFSTYTYHPRRVSDSRGRSSALTDSLAVLQHERDPGRD